MDEAALRSLLDQLAAGDVDADEVVRRVRRLPFAELGYAMVDHHRALRQGLPEAVYGPGKSAAQCVGIVGELLSGGDAGPGGGGPVVLSRATDEQIAAVAGGLPGRRGDRVDGGVAARAARGPRGWWWSRPAPPTCRWRGSVRPRCGPSGSGPPWSPTPEWPGCTGCSPMWSCCRRPTRSWWWPAWRGRWPAWSAGCARRRSWPCRPASATGPASSGVTALLAMLASCASGMVVVGIDNGFGAACAVARILRPGGRGRRPRTARLVARRPMTTVAWWHCFAGIAGDMALGSLVDAGADLDLVERELVALPVGGWTLEAAPVLRAGLACTQVRVRARDTQVVRTHAHIVGLITEARLPDRARQRALAAFARLAEVEGRLHRRPPSQVHFHEVGGTDAIIDIVGTCVALELLGVDEVRSSPVAQGSGHGAHLPRHPAGAGPGRGGTAAGGAHLRHGHPGGADDADRGGSAGHSVHRVGAHAGHGDHRPAASAPAAGNSTGCPTPSRW